ncbi:tryptophan--tRNA ligase [Candidatus Berkelbacteria bacterium RIFCSPLOWO2_01_FULL_50_28]|uniref:Tryptophan--tRNA ligase n=1 Tax=Candidatus Berkelbacteria bacterium RIFCSPLOWO2_01_FULL_50_28 TaxID=1797471 RepID=A0A1F5EBC3_9BACT|nr:MAG: tryptophan--tRNA ligase [Candidatus Berkelbacteria bacterium RIFCSPHIGHO2_01_FULL_50_36]OGD62893.1 MAG: tryptophan--tRNA ligase [Candidatus Berkelbacteria bacterium RIFCSPHIGHO2_12_FULL_50_11]OGD64566.1 MAG: tryptophan--tRNA ligase [Candidatus Berkelbacteria bacterium RIFCSPLOWO2_01_FULL_50_28]
MKRLVSGIKPTGELHLGNYLGAIKQFVDLQNDYDCFFFIADYHALTIRPTAKDLSYLTRHVAAMLIACGVDPKNTTYFLQSDISEHTELAWILSNFVSMGALNRMTQYKEKSDRHGQNAGLFTYPVLMAADVLLYDAEVVPVGDDQVQHLELARELVRSFNAHAEKTFIEPKPLLNTGARIMALNDPKHKMSKSIPGSAITLLDDETAVTQTIKRAVTDSDPGAKEMSPAVKNLFTILEGIGNRETYLRLENQYKDGTLRYSELKEQLIDDVIAFLGPIQKTYHALLKDEDALVQILEEGRKKAQPIAAETLAKAKKALGLIVG